MRGFEPPTPWSVAKCSIQLSYTHIFYLLIHYNTLVKCFEWMPQTGIEPVLYHYNRILSPARLPVPPLRHEWDLQGSNLWPSACKADALPAELRSHALLVVSVKWNSSDLIVIQSWIKTHYKRPRRDSNPWPPPWQGGALTNWATRPYKGLYLQNFIQIRFVFSVINQIKPSTY